MISPISNAAASNVQSAQSTSAQHVTASSSQPSKSTSLAADTVTLSSQAMAALAGTGVKSGSAASSYTMPSTAHATSSRAGAAS